MFLATNAMLATSFVAVILAYFLGDASASGYFVAFRVLVIFVSLLVIYTILQFLFVLISLARFHLKPASLQACIEGLGDAEFGAGRPSVAIQGSGFKYGYATGVLQYLYENFETDQGVFICNSSGIYPAIPVVCSASPIDWLLRDWPKCHHHWSTRPLGLLLDGTAFMDALWDNYLPEDAHVRATRSLRPVLVRLNFRSGANIMSIHTFESRRFLMEVLKATTGIPLVSLRSAWYSLPHMWCIDGAFCTRAVRLDESTVLVSPFSGNMARGFKFSVSPVKEKKTKTPRTLMGGFKKVREIFVAPPISVCLEHAVSGYGRAKELHAMFIEAGWVPRATSLCIHPELQKREAVAPINSENVDGSVPTSSSD